MKNKSPFDGSFPGALQGPGDETPSYLKLRGVIENLSRNPGADTVHYARTRGDQISLAQGEGDTPTPAFIADAAVKALSEGKTCYGPVLGSDDLRQEISSYYARIYGHQIPTNRIFVTASGTMAMHLAITALLEEDDEVVAITPIWRNLLGAVEIARGRIREVPLDEENGLWSLDLDRVFAAVNSRTKLILLTSPSNPSGWVMPESQMQALLDFARMRGLWIISDEVYGRLLYDRVRAPSFLDVAQPEDRLFIINSFSKNWAMTGWRLGWLTGPAAAEGAIRDIALYNMMCPPAFPQYGAIAALRHGEPFIREQLEMWQKNIDILMEYYARCPRIVAARPRATFYSLFRVEGEPDCLALTRRLIDEGGLTLAPGCSFGKVTTGYIRLCFAVSESRLRQAMERLVGVLGQ
ncbi:MAG: aminotransferase class I/II-fold pyridoxal phosphate-dependent enzyme [Rhodospirillales bacterium]|nr:aminotransferase class I/II-fold pyridoxal phosphate-dependent enzyme [Rhodospirillales bacterium]